MADTNLSAFLWSVADLLRGDFKQSEYGKVIQRALHIAATIDPGTNPEPGEVSDER